MVAESIVSGVWPTMLTPFTNDDRVDWISLERLINWYIGQGVHGLFAVCQSSEMFHLTLDERVRIAAFVKEKSRGRVSVIASGHIGGTFDEQVTELQALADTGVDALVLITNRLADEAEPEDMAISNVKRLLGELPEDIPLGFYECPFPYKRLLSKQMLEFCAESGRFQFIKDTCCDAEMIKERLGILEGTGIKLFNANTATLLESMRAGAAGYSGVMANFHPSLYVKLWNNFRSDASEKSETLETLLTMASLIEKQNYPDNAKYHLVLENILEADRSRVLPENALSETNRLEVRQLRRMTEFLSMQF